MSGTSDYLGLENVADTRGEEPAKVARQLVRRGCDLWLWFDGSKEYRSGEYESKHGSGWGYLKECIPPGHYRLAPEASTEVIRRISVDDFSVAGLVFVVEFAPDDTLSIRMAEDDATVCVVVNLADLSQLPPPPSEDRGASDSGHSTMREIFFSKNVESIESIPPDAFLKIRTPAGLGKLEALFADLEAQGMVPPGTTHTIGDHFTESALKDPSPEYVVPIPWINENERGKKVLYTLRMLVRSLRTNTPKWIVGHLENTAQHFSFKNETVTLGQLRAGFTGTEKRDRLEAILSKHEITCTS